MIKANYSDKALIVDILVKSFDSNKSVNFVIKQDKDREKRIRYLMEYSFELCYMFGEVYLSKCRNACILTLSTDKKKTSLKTIFLDLKLALKSIGITRIFKVLERDSSIKRNYPSSPITYIWFIGVIPSEQGKGLGKKLLETISTQSIVDNRPLYLETSMEENLRFYTRAGFEIYKIIEKPHKLYLIRKNLN